MISIIRFDRDTLDLLLMLMFITISGNPFFTADMTGLVTVFLFSAYLFYDRKRTFSKEAILFFTVLLIIYLFQTLIFSFYSISNISGMFVRILTGYFVLKVLDTRFIEYYIRIMFLLALMSLFFYVITSIDANLLAPLSTTVSAEEDYTAKYSLFGLYTFMNVDALRNSGNFWEAGAFGGYLLIAYMFDFYSKTDSNKKRRSLVFLISIISTFSTTAYLVLFTFLFIATYRKIKNVLARAVAILVILGSGFYAFHNVEFIGAKIEAQLVQAKDVSGYRGNTNTQRFLNILRDVEDFKGHEFFGRGTHPSTRYSFDPKNQIRTVGLTDILVKFGLPFFFLILYLMYRSICKYLATHGQKDTFNCVSIFVGILLTLMSEAYFNYPLYWSLLFLLFVYKRPESLYEGSRIK